MGGGTSGALGEIVKSYPHIKVINLDLPHVAATTPMCEGVIHVGGDMFDPIPNADALFMKVTVWFNRIGFSLGLISIEF